MSEFAYLHRAAARGIGAMCQMAAQPCYMGSNQRWGIGSRLFYAQDAHYYNATGEDRLFCVGAQPIPLPNIPPGSSTPSGRKAYAVGTDRV